MSPNCRKWRKAQREHKIPNDFLSLFGDSAEAISVDAGQALFQKGEAASGLYVVKSGELQILDGNQRAVTASQVIPLDEKRFLFVVQQTPNFAIRVMKVMSIRLRAMNERARTMPGTAA